MIIHTEDNRTFELSKEEYRKFLIWFGERELIEVAELIEVSEPDNSAWDFQWNGHGDYETERRAFYGEFS